MADEVADTLGGAPSAAILMMLLDEDEAAAVLRHLDPDEVRQLGSEMFAAAEADEKTVGSALTRFVSGSREVSALAPGAGRKIRSVMSEALGDARAEHLLSTIAPQAASALQERLRWIDSGVIGSVLANEHPQAGAVIVSLLTPDVAARAMAGIDAAQQAELLYRAARLRPVRAEAMEDIEAALTAAEAERERIASVELGGESQVARIVNSLPRTDGESLLRMMRKRDKLLASAIEDEMFVFEDLNRFDAKSLGAVLRGVDASILTLALRGADAALADRFLATMSARAADTIRDGLAEMGPVKREDVDGARRQIIAIARAMAAAGEIVLDGKSDEYV